MALNNSMIKNRRYIFTTLLPLHLMLLLLMFSSLSWIHGIYFLIGYVLIYGLGVNVGLHRWASHRSIVLNQIAKPFVVYLSIIACQGQPMWWVALHRGYHHRKCDSLEDQHSPIHLGKFHAFIGWIFKHDPSSINFRYSANLAREFWIVKTHKYYEIIIWTTWIIAGLISLDLLLWMFIIPSIVGLHTEGLVNSLCHGKNGYANYKTTDQSRNVHLLGYVSWGNGWHNNHHYNQSKYNFGGTKWWEFDPCVIFLPFIKK